EIREDLPNLRDDVVAADEPAVAVDGDEAGEEQELACANRVGVMAHRLGELRNPDLLAAAHRRTMACARIAVSVVRGLIASGSIRSSSTADVPAASARSNAAGNAAVSVTVSPCAPNARAYAAKSGLTRSVPTTWPGNCRSWCMRIVPYIPLFTTMITTGSSYCTAVASSCPVIRKSPSPAKQI